MRRIIFLSLFFAIGFFAVSCGSKAELPINKAAQYAEKTVETKLPLRLKLNSENCNLEIYRWKKQEVKFEYTTSVTGEYSTERLAKELESFSVEVQASDKEVAFSSAYSNRNRTEGEIELRVYLPKKTDHIEVLCKKGNLKLFDDMEGELVIQADMLNVDINRLDGKLNCSIKEGDVRLTAGKLTDGSMIETRKGNIRLKAEYDPAGTYCFIAREGLLDIFVPKNLNTEFIDDIPVEYVETKGSSGEYAGTGRSEDESNRDIASFRLVSGIDRILITRF